MDRGSVENPSARLAVVNEVISADEEWQVHLALESRFENIELVQVVLDESLDRLCCDEDSRYWIGIAVREALANAIKHGNQQDPEKKVGVEVRLERSDIVIRVTDEGCGFDPDCVESPLEEANLLKPNGRGIFYMDKFMDEIRYDFGPEGTELTLRKRIDPGQARSGESEEKVQ